ncbi:lactate utilization protein [Lachnospiraceae bacterium JLR.KK008]
MTPKEEAFATLAKGIVENLRKREMEGFYFENSTALCDHLKQMLPENAVISWGGSESLRESGVMDLLENGRYKLIDRAEAKTPEEKREIFSRTVMADYYFMSTNAITMDGELINIDGNGNRIACLVQGPSHVCLIVGRNKVSTNIADAIARARNIAAPANVKRLHKQTPCQQSGRCGDCFSPDCICSHLVITRRSQHPGRIQVYLVNEDLGY